MDYVFNISKNGKYVMNGEIRNVTRQTAHERFWLLIERFPSDEGWCCELSKVETIRYQELKF